MNDPRRQSWLPYVRKIADLMNLKDWEIKVDNDEPSTKDYVAECYIPEGRRMITICFSDSFLDHAPESQRETVVHELQHCHTEILKLGIQKTVDNLIWSVLKINFEQSVDDTAMYVAKFMPLPIMSRDSPVEAKG